MGLASFQLLLMTGFIGVASSLLFNMTLYASVESKAYSDDIIDEVAIQDAEDIAIGVAVEEESCGICTAVVVAPAVPKK